MYPLLSAFPIAYTLFTMIALRQPSKKVLPQALLITVVIAFAFWRVDLDRLIAYTIFGSLKAFDIIVIVFGALLIFNTLEYSGAMFVIGRSFNHVTQDHRILLLIAYLLVQLIEGAAGFGTPAAIVAPILIGLGIPPLPAVCFALIADSTGVSFGAVGTPVIGLSSAVSLGPEVIRAVGVKTAWLTSLGGVAVPPLALLLAMKGFSPHFKWRDLIDILPLAGLAALLFLLPLNLLAFFAGYETPTLVAAAIALVIFVPLVKGGFWAPKTCWRFPSAQDSPTADVQLAPVSPLKAWAPYALIVLILVVTRIPALGMTAVLKAQKLVLPSVLGVKGLDYSFRWAYLPGVVPFTLVALICIPLLKMNRRTIVHSWRETFGQIKGATIALISGVAMVQVMLNSSNAQLELGNMVGEIARVLVQLPSTLFVFFSPLIGILGAFMSGSNTVSNILFAPLQSEAAQAYGFDVATILAMQNVGGAIGNMICINNVLAALAVSGLLSKKGKQDGLEGRVVKLNMLPVLCYALLTSLVALLLL